MKNWNYHRGREAPALGKDADRLPLEIIRLYHIQGNSYKYKDIIKDNYGGRWDGKEWTTMDDPTEIFPSHLLETKVITITRDEPL